MSDIKKLLEVMKQLRDPESGCPWDLEQDFSTIAPFTIEEAYEVADAIHREDWEDLKSELGDLLFQVVFYAQMASEAGHFEFDEIADGITEKMMRRHPHVFGGGAQRDTRSVRGRWEDIKEEERADRDDQSALAGVAKALPALKRAQKLGKRAARVGFDWPQLRGVQLKIHEELEELQDAIGSRDEAHVEEELGDLLFAVVNLARHLDVDPEKALSVANTKFEQRFRAMEADIMKEGGEIRRMSLEALEQHWRKAKNRLG
ncbi:MAG TPA: nucleoside triphosphate pyrophosphohydrolase [Woeseiaceae bacterium]|jgi:MazG family protein|nr:nucleoside triphosphate pyrophosphohydrolase [Woeseiaceae bacterium]